MMHIIVVFLFFILYTLRAASAQQYAGDEIRNGLPEVPGAEISFFRIADPAGINQHLTLTNYYALQQTGERIVPEDVQRALILVHGLDRNPGYYMVHALNALAEIVKSDPSINTSSVAIICPYFPNGRDKHVSYPWQDGLGPGQGSTSNALVWLGSKWSAGANNQYPHNAQTVSSFEVLDQLVKFFDDRTQFPRMKQIVVGGHSLGAQTVQRYAQIGNDFPTTSPVLYYIANPNSWTWMDEHRPLDTSACPSYDSWRHGFANFTQYPMSYGADLVAQGRLAVLGRWNARSKAFAQASIEPGDHSTSCAPSTQGEDRQQRFLNFIKAFPPSCVDGGAGRCDTVDYVDTGHDVAGMFTSAAGQARLFRDNFLGDGMKARDFGYPRLQAEDNPFPEWWP